MKWLRPFNVQVVTELKTKAPLLWETLKTSKKEAFLRKFTRFNNWYVQVLGLDEVKKCQDRVITLQERLLQAQEKRRYVAWNLAQIRKKSNQLQDEIHKLRRQDNIEEFLTLMKEEAEVLKLESEASRTFQEHDQAERELFCAFTNAVRDSHEKQRAQLEYTKYFGIILSITGSLLAFCYSTLRKDDLKEFIEQTIKNGAVQVNNNDNSFHDKLIKLVRNETAKLNEKINWKLKEKEKEETEQLRYFIGAGVVFLVIIISLKIVAT